MGKYSQLISDRYQLELSSQWSDWFDNAAYQLRHPGFFRLPVDVIGLCQTKPTQIWGGFMLPDTIPLISNGYGDWICARVSNNNHLAELIHWYHGGGDWIPVGNCMAEALLHDAIDSLRPIRKQMLRGAVESFRPTDDHAFSANWKQWLQESLQPVVSPVQAQMLPALLQAAESGDYAAALQLVTQLQLAPSAAACDQIERLIQTAIPSEQAALNMLEQPQREQLVTLCQNVVSRRDDLGWSHSLLGLMGQHSGHKTMAIEHYFAGRFASAFSDQSVRLRLHRFEKRYGKFSIAQLAAHKGQLTDAMRADDYLNLYFASSLNLVERVQDYWLTQGTVAADQGDFAAAYAANYRAGWDLGAASLTAYRKILERLHDAAHRAGWQAKAAVAQSHLACL